MVHDIHMAGKIQKWLHSNLGANMYIHACVQKLGCASAANTGLIDDIIHDDDVPPCHCWRSGELQMLHAGTWVWVHNSCLGTFLCCWTLAVRHTRRL